MLPIVLVVKDHRFNVEFSSFLDLFLFQLEDMHLRDDDAGDMLAEAGSLGEHEGQFVEFFICLDGHVSDHESVVIPFSFRLNVVEKVDHFD